MSPKPSKAPEVVLNSRDDLRGLLVDVIDRSGLTRYAIAQQTGLDETTLSRMYTGKRPVTLEVLIAVAGATGRQVVVRVE